MSPKQAETESQTEDAVQTQLEEANEDQAVADVEQPAQNGKSDTADQRQLSLIIPKAVSPQPVPEDADWDHPSLYFNRELGWLDFNWRVFYQALDERHPLLERVRFLAITASNLDEFTQKRIGGLKRQEAAGVSKLSPDGRTPTEQLALIRRAAQRMHGTMTETWELILKPAIEEQAGIVICDYDDLTSQQKETLHHFFQDEIYPILTPLTVDPGHPFPFISNLSLSLAVILRHPEQNTTHFARLKVPTSLRRFLPLDTEPDDKKRYFLPVEQLITHHVSELFAGMDVVSAHPFRITRNADLRRDEEEAEDLLAMISDELRERRFAPVVRLEAVKDMPAYNRSLLIRELGLQLDDVYEVEGLIDLTACFQIADLGPPQCAFEPWVPAVPSRLAHEGETKDTLDIFAIIRRGDLLVHHPYDSFTVSVQRFVEEAAVDKNVLAIKQTLYRTSDESPIVKALMHAAESGKQVAVLIEVKARFDEANNIEWGRMMENVGIHVTYGLVGFKTHTKATLIVRQEDDAVRSYCHIGTGNYNPKTARLYTDLGLLTCNPDLGRDMVNLFHFLTGYAPNQKYRKFIVAPHYMRHRFNELIDKEIEFQQQYGNGHIIAKMNGLDDTGIIQQLYRASQVGVKIDLIVRGHSRLRPGLKGFSENIRIISIVGRFLEHDRIFYFNNNNNALTYIGSADWRGRNLNDRIELITPIEEPALRHRLIQILESALSDNRLAWDLDAEGNHIQRRPANSEEERNFHRVLMKQALKRSKNSGSF